MRPADPWVNFGISVFDKPFKSERSATICQSLCGTRDHPPITDHLPHGILDFSVDR
jgi:hypothetical protein